MGSKSKKLKINFSCRHDVAFGEDAPAGACERALNLRSVGSVLKPVGQLRPLTTLASGERLLVAHRTAGGVNLITAIDGYVRWHGVVNEGVCTVVGKTIGELAVTVDCATALGDFVVLGTADGDKFLHFSGGEYRLLDPELAIPAINLTASATETVTETVPDYTFSGYYTRWQSPLTSDDLTALSANIRLAYNRILTTAEAQSAYLQPILARYAVRLFDDSYLWVSQPVVVGMGVQCGGERSLTVSNDGTAFTSVAGFDMTAELYTIKAIVSAGFDSSWDNLVKSVDIIVTDEAEPLITGQSVEYRCATSTTGTRQQYLNVKFRTSDSGMVMRSLIETEKWRVAYMITDFAALRVGTATLTPVTSGAEVSADTITACVARLSRQRHSTSLLAHGRSLFSSGATAKLRSGWGAVPIVNVDSTTYANETYEAIIKAKINTVNGLATTVWHGNGKGRPVSLNPLMAYPDSRATAVTVTVKSASGAVSSAELTLLPAVSSGMAYVSGTYFAPISLNAVEVSTFEVPEEVNVMESVAGIVCESESLNPLVISAEHVVCDGSVRALGGSIHHANNVIGTPVYVFSDGGVYALPYRTVSASYAPAVIISRHIIAKGVNTANTDSRLCFVTENGELYSIDQYKVERVLGDIGTATSMTYNLHRRELWISGANGEVMALQNDGTTFTRGEKFAMMLPSQEIPLALTSTEGGVVYSIADEVSNLADVELLTEPFSPSTCESFVPEKITLNMSSADGKVAVTVYGDTGYSCHGMMLCRMTFEGQVNSPIVAKLFAPKLRKMRIMIAGKMPSDSIIGGLMVNFREIC